MTKGRKIGIGLVSLGIIATIGLTATSAKGLLNEKVTNHQGVKQESQKQEKLGLSKITTASNGDKIVTLKSGVEAIVKPASEFDENYESETVEAYKEFVKGPNLDLNKPKNAKDKAIIDKNSKDGVYSYKGRFYYKGQLANGFFQFTVTDEGETVTPFNLVDGVIAYLFNSKGLMMNVGMGKPANIYSQDDNDELKIENGKVQYLTDEGWEDADSENPKGFLDYNFGRIEYGLFIDTTNDRGDYTLIPYWSPDANEAKQEGVEKIYVDEANSNIVLD